MLAQQHYQTVLQRFFGYPVKTELLSRFNTPSEVKSADKYKSGAADIVVGTHRLLGKDVVFKDSACSSGRGTALRVSHKNISRR